MRRRGPEEIEMVLSNDGGVTFGRTHARYDGDALYATEHPERIFPSFRGHRPH